MSLFAFIKQQVPIMDEVGRYVQLKQAGNYYKGPCPFHRETDASFTVSPDKQIFYCFGCHTSGDVVSFVAKAENLTQIEAVHYLVDAHKLTIPEDIARQAAHASKQADEKANYFSLCRVVANWAHAQLRSYSHAHKYVLDRSISQKTIDSFGIGYIPGGQKSLNALAKECAANNILVKDLIAAGIFFEGRGEALRSPFEERIIFPITDALGRHCGFGGRIFIANDERAKYYNSKESPFFVKGNLLFGYALAKKEMQERKNVFLVEGYTDCVALAQHGYPNVVATLGTACTLDHLQLLARIVEKVYVLYDGDRAGHKAMMRMAQLCWQVNLELHVVTLPGNLDPAGYLEQHDDLSVPVAQAQDIFVFFVNATTGDFMSKTLAGKMQAVQAIIAMIVRVPDIVKREILLQNAAQAMQIPINALRSKLHEQSEPVPKKTMSHAAVTEQDRVEDDDTLPTQITAISVNSMLQAERLEVPLDGYPYFPEQSVRVFKVIASIQAQGQQAFEAVVAACKQEDRDWLIAATMRYGGSVGEEEFKALVSKVVQHGWKEQVSRIRSAIEQASQQNDTAKVQELVQKFAKLKQQMQQKGLIWQKKQQQN